MSPGRLRHTVLTVDITSGASLRTAAGPVSDTELADSADARAADAAGRARAESPVATNRRRVIVGSASARSW
jgi:hypothetical protein